MYTGRISSRSIRLHSSASLVSALGVGLLLISQLSLYLVQHYQSVLVQFKTAEPVLSVPFLPWETWQGPLAHS